MSVSTAFTVSGSITKLSSNVVYVSSYGITAYMPASLATFNVSGVTKTYSQLAVGQYVSVTVNPFSGSLYSVSGVSVTVTTSKGKLCVPAQTLPAATQKQIYVYVKLSNGSTQVMTLYDAFRTSGVTILTAAPRP